MVKDGYAKAKEIAAWKENVAAHWDEIEVLSVHYDDSLINHGVEVGDILSAEVVVDKHGIDGNIGLEIVQMRTDLVNNLDTIKVHGMNLDKQEGSKLYFSIQTKASQPGNFKFGLRIYPDNKDLAHRMDFAYVKWVNI